MQDHTVHQASGKSARGHGRLKQGVSAERKPMQYTSFTSDSLWSDILEFAKVKYQVPLKGYIRCSSVLVIYA